MEQVIIWVSDWDFANVLDQCLGKGNGDTFMNQLDEVEDLDKYCPKAQQWASDKKIPVVFHSVRVAETGDHFDWHIEFTNPTGRLLRTLHAELSAETG